MNPLLSIIILNRNNTNDAIEATIRYLVDILGDHLKDTEIIVTDYGASDFDYLEGATDKYLTVIHSDIANDPIVMNKAIDTAIGKWITFMDVGDKLLPDFITDFFSNYSIKYAPVNIIIGNIIRNNRIGPDLYGHGGYTSPDTVHGSFYRRSFLNDNDIRFPDGDNNDIIYYYEGYFNRKAFIANYYNYQYVFRLHKPIYEKSPSDSNVEEDEERYGGYVKSCIRAFKDAPDKAKFINCMYLLLYSESHLTEWRNRSENFKESNIDVLCSLLLYIENHFGIVHDTLYEAIISRYAAYNKWFEDFNRDFYPMGFFGPIYTQKAYDIIKLYDDEKRKTISKILEDI